MDNTISYNTLLENNLRDAAKEIINNYIESSVQKPDLINLRYEIVEIIKRHLILNTNITVVNI